MRVHAGPRRCPCGAPRGRGSAGKMIGGVTQKRYTAPQFKLDCFHIFFRVGLCPTRFLPFAGDVTVT